MVVRKRLEGEVQYNDGQFAEVQTVGTDGIDKDLLLAKFHVQREDTHDTPEEFQGRFPVGRCLDIWASVEITGKPLAQLTGLVAEAGSVCGTGAAASQPTRQGGVMNEPPTIPDDRRVLVHQHLEAALRLQRDSWDEVYEIEQLTGDRVPDIYSFVAELAGGFEDHEKIPGDVIDQLIGLPEKVSHR
jgi:hypothetical protein